MSNQPTVESERGIIGESLNIVGKYFVSRLLVSLIFAVVSYLVMWLLLDLKWGIPIAIVIGLANLVPYIGPTVAMVLSAAFVLIQSIPGIGVASPIDVVWMMITLFGLQILDAVLLSPLMLGKSLGLHPLIVFFAIFIGGSMFGILGVVLATPIAAIAALIARRIRKSVRERQAANEAVEQMEKNGEEENL